MIEEGTKQEFKRSVLAELPTMPKRGEIWQMVVFETPVKLKVDRFLYDFKRGWCIDFVIADESLDRYSINSWVRLPMEDFMLRVETGRAQRIQ